MDRAVLVPRYCSLEFGLCFHVVMKIGVRGPQIAMDIRLSWFYCKSAVQVRESFFRLVLEQVCVAKVMKRSRMPRIQLQFRVKFLTGFIGLEVFPEQMAQTVMQIWHRGFRR